MRCRDVALLRLYIFFTPMSNGNRKNCPLFPSLINIQKVLNQDRAIDFDTID
jgi:hypothetical protein